MNSKKIDKSFEKAISAHQQGHFSQAEAIYEQILALVPEHPDPLHMLGVLRWQTGDAKSAVELISKAIRGNPENPTYHYNLANAFVTLGDDEAAIEHYDTALASRPDYTNALINKANALKRRKDYSEAIAILEKVLKIVPNSIEALNNLGNTYVDIGDYQKAISIFQTALDVQNDYSPALTNLGNAYRKLGDVDKAEALYRKAARLSPDDIDAHFNLSTLLLSQAKFDEGWREYEWRLKKAQLASTRLPSPRWNGAPVPGKTILVLCEQGLGDSIQFFRYLPTVAEQCEKLVFHCQKPLIGLLRPSCPGEIVDNSVAAMNIFHDLHVPLLSLPQIFKTTLNDIPSPSPYLDIDEKTVERWRKILTPGLISGLPAIGLCWAGSPTNTNDQERSIPFETLTHLLKKRRANFISLQKGGGEETARKFAESNDHMQEFASRIRDFRDTAAIVANLDRVITVDTAVAHLAGAMGKPVDLLIPFDGEWRWLRDRSDSPWYPSMTIHRQPSPGAWEEVVEKL